MIGILVEVTRSIVLGNNNLQLLSCISVDHTKEDSFMQHRYHIYNCLLPTYQRSSSGISKHQACYNQLNCIEQNRLKRGNDKFIIQYSPILARHH